MKIRSILHIYYSRSDTFGNRYWAFNYRTTSKGHIVINGTFGGGESNILSAVRCMHENWSEIYYHTEEVTYKEYQRLVKNIKHAGTHPDEIVKYIKSELRNAEKLFSKSLDRTESN